MTMQQNVYDGNNYNALQQGFAIQSNVVPELREPRAGERLQEMNQRLADHILRLQALVDRVRGSRPMPVSGDSSGSVNGTAPLMQSIEYAVGHVSHIGGLLDDLEALI